MGREGEGVMPYITLKNGVELFIRTAVEADAPEILQLFNQMGGESQNLTFGLNDYYLNENQQRLFIKSMRERHNSLFIVAMIQNRIMGYLTFTTMQRGRLMHRGDLGLSVLKQYWGLGVGNALLAHLMNWIEAGEGGVPQGISKIDLQVRADNERAIRLYEKWGFEMEGCIKRGMKIENSYYDVYYMGKCIGQ